MRHSLRAVSLSWLLVLVPILAGSAADGDGNGRVPGNDARATRNRAPIARKDAATTAMDTSVTINVTANDSDSDGRIVPRTVRIVGRPRNGTARKRRNGRVIYTPKPGFSGQDTLSYRVKDNRGARSNRARVRVTVRLGARTPVANADTAATAIDTPVVINVVANDTDADGNLDPRSVAIATNPRSGGLVNRFDGTVTYTPFAGFFGTDAFAYTVGDGQGATSDVARVTVTVGPVAAAGPDQNAVTGLPVTLNGSASFDPDGNSLAFSWRFVSKPPTSVRADTDIVNPTSPAPSFTPDVDGAYELELRVTDGTLSDTDRVVITAAPVGQVPPNANAGPDQPAAVAGTLVTLNGSASNDPDNAPNPLTFSWAFAERPVGSTATLTNATTAQPSFTPDVVGIYRVTLTVSDGAFSGQDEVVITATAPTTTTTLPPTTTTTFVGDTTTTTVTTSTTTTTTLPLAEIRVDATPLLTFSPLEVNVQSGQTVRFINATGVTHNIGVAPCADRFDLTTCTAVLQGNATIWGAVPPTGGAGITATFMADTLLFCTLHDGMQVQIDVAPFNTLVSPSLHKF